MRRRSARCLRSTWNCKERNGVSDGVFWERLKGTLSDIALKERNAENGITRYNKPM